MLAMHTHSASSSYVACSAWLHTLRHSQAHRGGEKERKPSQQKKNCFAGSQLASSSFVCDVARLLRRCFTSTAVLRSDWSGTRRGWTRAEDFSEEGLQRSVERKSKVAIRKESRAPPMSISGFVLVALTRPDRAARPFFPPDKTCSLISVTEESCAQRERNFPFSRAEN